MFNIMKIHITVMEPLITILSGVSASYLLFVADLAKQQVGRIRCPPGKNRAWFQITSGVYLLFFFIMCALSPSRRTGGSSALLWKMTSIGKRMDNTCQNHSSQRITELHLNCIKENIHPYILITDLDTTPISKSKPLVACIELKANRLHFIYISSSGQK